MVTSAIEKRLLKKLQEQEPVILSADCLVELLKEIERLRNQVESLRVEVLRNFDTFVEHIPCEDDNGGVVWKVFSEDRDAPANETYKRVTVSGDSLTVEEW